MAGCGVVPQETCEAFQSCDVHYTDFFCTGREQALENDGYKDELYTKRVRAGKRTYFFDVKSTKSEKDFYITITESKRVGDDEYEKHKIFLYKEDFEKFREALTETVDYVQTQLLEPLALEKAPGS